ncbi:MAG TPA: hypothetical protein VF527_14490 [Pyrinomonadaceae bacterium]|jgi:hypothetical protein
MSTEIEQKIIADFDLTALSDAGRATAIGKVNSLLSQAILLRACDVLTETQLDALDDYLGTLEPHTEQTPQLIYEYLARNVPRFQVLVQEEYEKLVVQFKKLNANEAARQAKIRDNAGVEEFTGSAIGFASDTLSEVPSVDGNLLAVASLLTELVADPSSARRTKKEKLKRINAVCSNAIQQFILGIFVGYFTAAITYTGARVLKDLGLIAGIPEILALPIPKWFEELGLPAQAGALAILAVVSFAVQVLSRFALEALVRRGFFNFLYREKKIQAADRVTEMFKNHALFEKIEPSMGSHEMLLRSCGIIYKGVFLEQGKDRCQTTENFEILDGLLLSIATDEDAVVRFLKPKIINYRRSAQSEVSRFIENALSLLDSISPSSPAGRT